MSLYHQQNYDPKFGYQKAKINKIHHLNRSLNQIEINKSSENGKSLLEEKKDEQKFVSKNDVKRSSGSRRWTHKQKKLIA